MRCHAKIFVCKIKKTRLHSDFFLVLINVCLMYGNVLKIMYVNYGWVDFRMINCVGSVLVMGKKT
jgi:hypothetical protein